MENPRPEKIRRFKDLVAWKSAYELALSIYKATDSFPNREVFGLTSQMRRASVSCTSNIAEGFGRATSADKMRFYTIALASITELQSQIELAHGLQFIDTTTYNALIASAEKTYGVTQGLLRTAADRV